MKKYLILVVFLLTVQIVQAHESCNETIELLPEGYCNITLTLETDKQEYKNGDKITIYNKLSNKSYDFSIEYWAENENETIIKEKLETKNTNQKQFTPRLEENQTIVIKNNLTNIDCININNSTYNELRVFVEVEKETQPNLTIEKIYLNRSRRAYLGNNFTTLISAYSGNETNYTIEYFIENITNKSNYTINEKFNYSKFNITTQIPLNCNITTGEYQFTVKSKQQELRENITIINNCEENMTTNQTAENESINTVPETNNSENIINQEEGPLTGNIIYESRNIKAKKIVPYLLMVILAAVTIAIIITNKNTEKALKKQGEWSSQLEQL